MKKLLLSLFISAACITAHAQLVVNSGLTAAQVVAGFMGSGLTVSNINLNCASNACGTFSNGNTTNLGVTNGSIFTSGAAAGAIGPNNSTGYSVSNGTYVSDPDLTTIEPNATNDPCILSFNVIPSCSTLTIKFVFGSEEYPEYVNASFNDAFGFFITGPNPSGPAYNGYNVARLPNGTPVSIDNVNAGNNAAYYVSNSQNSVQYDGFTTAITSNLAVVPCQTYFFKIAIADAGDYIYDSGVFIDLLTCSTAIVSTTSSSPTCGCSGTASVNASGGQPPYTYVWNTSPVQNTPTATGLCPGNYVVTVYDQTGCNSQSNQSTITVGSVPAGTASIATQTNVSCNGGNNGSATATITGGTAPYTYVWSTVPAQNTQTATGLSSGSYNVTVYDANGCSSVTSVTISQPNVLSSAIVSSINVSCNGGNNGSATVSVGGGTPNYTYVWSPAGGNAATANNLPAGNYNVVVTDANGCTTSANVTINQPTALTSTVSSSTQTGCFTATGTATANGNGGTPNYTYSWSTSPAQNTQTATGLGIGTYNVIVTDANGCTSVATVNINAAAAPVITSTSVTPAACSVNNGTANATASGGTPNYTYSWIPCSQTSPTATGLAGGNYTVIITDANGCSATSVVNVPSTAAPTATVSSVNAKCGLNNGSATAIPSGGNPAYTYVWSPAGGNAATANNLGAGNYTVTVTDANGCSATASVAITAASNPTVTAAVTNTISCNGGKNGSASSNVTGGTATYTYQWSTNPLQTTPTATGLGTGTYNVTVTDANGCTSMATVTLTQPNLLTASVASTNVKCNGQNNGTATATMNGGNSPYTYIWSTSPQQNSQTATGLAQGSYNVTITDANGCTAQSSINITQPQTLSAATAQVNPKCNGGKNGSATATPAGGTSPYTYAWNTTPPQNTQTANNLGAGTYTVTVTDKNGCTALQTVIITQPPAINITISGNDSICAGKNTSLIASTSGGTPAYTYVWNPGPQSGTIVNVHPTTSTSYSVTMTDANGCTSVMQVFNVIVLPSANADFDTTSSGNFNTVYQFSDSSTGGTSWSWNFGDPSSQSNTSTQQNPSHTFSGSGTYTVTQIVYNKFGCPDTFKLIVKVEEGILIPNVFTPDGDGYNDVWYIPNSGMKEFHVEIYNRWGEKVWETTADEIRWDGRSFSGKQLNDGTYYFALHAILKSGADEKDYSTKGYVTILTKK